MVHALQHAQTALLVQPSSPRYLRSTHISYTDPSSIANPRRVYFPGARPAIAPTHRQHHRRTTTTTRPIRRLLQHQPPTPSPRQTHPIRGLQRIHESQPRRQPHRRMAYTQRQSRQSRPLHHPLRRQALPPRNGPKIHRPPRPDDHQRPPHHHITQRHRRHHHRALHRHQPQLPSPNLETRRTPTQLTPRKQKAPTENKNSADAHLSTMSRQFCQL